MREESLLNLVSTEALIFCNGYNMETNILYSESLNYKNTKQILFKVLVPFKILIS